MQALILGGGGFLGCHVTRAFSDAGYTVTACLHKARGASPRLKNVRYVVADVLEGPEEELAHLLAGADIVCDLAWEAHPSTPERDVQVNVAGTLRLVQICAAAGVGRFVFVSSGGTVYGPARALPIPETHPTDPRTSYGAAKLAVEKYLALFGLQSNLDYVILRPGNPFGPYQDPRKGQGVIMAFLARIAAGRPLKIWGDGNVVRDYFYVGDLARAVVLAASSPVSGTAFNLGSGTGRSLHDVVQSVFETTGCTVPVITRPGRPGDVPINVLDTRKARACLGWRPLVSFEEGLARTWASCRQTTARASRKTNSPAAVRR